MSETCDEIPKQNQLKKQLPSYQSFLKNNNN